MSTNLVSLVRNLQQRKGRKRRGLAVAEGVRLVEEALAAEVEFRGVVAGPGLSGTPRGAALLRDLTARAVQVEEVSDRQLAELADTDTPQGIVAVIRPPRFQLGQVVPDPRVPTLVLDGVQDPGNVGTLLRTAFALGSPGAILLEGTADVANPKVMRAAMGATFRLPAAPAVQGELVAWAERHAVEIWAADPEGTPLERATPPGRLAIVVGNEGTGVRPAVAALARHRVAIRLARGAESLNVAVAAGILLYEVHRAAT